MWYSKNLAIKWAILGMTGILVGHLLHGQLCTEAEAQVPPHPITSSGLNTQISAPLARLDGATQHNITGGTRPGGGANLFHSFGEFGVPTNNIANFLNDSGLPTSNILSRVTGGNLSNILGRIKTEGFEKANLFLMNPAGVVFGQNASVHVGGAAYFTTADYLRLNDGVQFTALPGAQDALLSIAPVAAFGFLGTNPAAISVDGSTLSVEEGQTLSLVGGDISIGSSALTARSGKIAVASVASPGEVLTDTFASAPNVIGEFFTGMGKITLSEGATLDVGADSAGTVIIRGGELIMANAVISADTVNENGAPVAIDIDVTGNVSLTTVDGPALTARTSGAGHAGEIKLSSGGAMNISGMLGGKLPFPVFSIIDTHTSGSGNAGNVNLASQGGMTVTGDFPEGFVFLADTGMDGLNTGKGGDLSISARNFTIRNAFIATGNYVSTLIGEGVGDGPAGNVFISANEGIDVSVSQILTDSDGKAGNVTLAAPDINFDSGNISTSGFARGGNVNIDADTLTLSNATEVATITRTEHGGAVTITARIVDLSASSIVSTTKEHADAGDITITATERLSLLNPAAFLDEDRASSIASNSFESSGKIRGAPGDILIETPLLTIDGGSKINSSSGSSGTGGNILINAEKIFMSGQTSRIDLSDLQNFGEFPSTGVFTNTLGGNCAGPCGSAGNVKIMTESIVLEKGAQINSSTRTAGAGGAISVNATDTISISGTLQDGTSGGVLSQTTGSGSGGTISLRADKNFTLSDRATVSASSSGSGNAGNIQIAAADTIMLNRGSINTEVEAAFGGNIKLTAGNFIRLTDSQVTSLVQKGSGNAGSITLDPDFIVIKNSKVLSTAIFGNGGPITLIANSAILIDPFSRLNADSQFGGSGTITIQSPIQNLSGTITPLPQNTLPVTALYGSNCVAGAGGHFSTFVDSKAGSLAPSPGTFLASPFLPLSNPPHTVGNAGTFLEASEKEQATLLQLASYAPPVLFAKADRMASACP